MQGCSGVACGYGDKQRAPPGRSRTRTRTASASPPTLADCRSGASSGTTTQNAASATMCHLCGVVPGRVCGGRVWGGEAVTRGE